MTSWMARTQAGLLTSGFMFSSNSQFFSPGYLA